MTQSMSRFIANVEYTRSKVGEDRGSYAARPPPTPYTYQANARDSTYFAADRGPLYILVLLDGYPFQKAGLRTFGDQHYMGGTYLRFTLKLEWIHKRTNETGNA